MWRTESTNQDAEAALVACLRHFAARGRNLRERREHERQAARGRDATLHGEQIADTPSRGKRDDG
jgi:hypothetical protein